MRKQLQLIFLSCKKASMLIEMSHNKPLSSRHKVQLKMHLKLCDRCARYKQQSLFIETVLKLNHKTPIKTTGMRLSDASKLRIQKALDEKMKNK